MSTSLTPATFDPDAAAQPGTGIFGLPFERKDAGIVLVPVPFDATTSYGNGTAKGPEAIRVASMQVDLHDHQFGPVYKRGIFTEPHADDIAALSVETRAMAEPLIAKGGADESDTKVMEAINDAGERVNAFTYKAVKSILNEGKTPGLVGGDHSTPFGSIKACAEHAMSLAKTGLGILHIDAHMDLRVAFEGFKWSHASIMYNVMEQIPQVKSLVQVGIRDYGKGELEYAQAHHDRIHTFFDLDWERKMEDGEVYSKLIRHAIGVLPEHVYVSFDIDGLDPSMCPHTGTPVPGGLSFHRACMLLECLVKARHKIVGFDLVEVAPGPNAGEPDWDANVGARMLYKLCGIAAAK
ncbi:MAG: agmatinase family protein [Pyrinomonadaceae bacterium]|nr:agmatinase family protein [Phycisphaerales bacterium]